MSMREKAEVVVSEVDGGLLESNCVNEEEAEVVVAEVDEEPIEPNCVDVDVGRSSRDAEVDGTPLGHLHMFYKLSMGYKNITSFFHPEL
jgi:hypothetical protein